MLELTPEETKAVLEILKKVSFSIDAPKEKVDALQSAYQKLLALLTKPS